MIGWYDSPMRRPVPALLVSAGQREVLESVARSQSAPHREVVRARALLMAADGAANTAIARELSVSPASVSGWRPVRRGRAGQVRAGPRGPGPQEHDPAGDDRRDRGSDAELPSAGANPLELPDHGRGYRSVEIDCAAGVVGAGAQTAPGRDVQAVQRSEVRGEARRRRRALFESAAEGDRLVRRREVLGAGTGPHPGVAADGQGARRDDDP